MTNKTVATGWATQMPGGVVHVDVHPAATEAMLAERERIARAIEDEADMTPCEEDAQVMRQVAALVRANFSYDDADILSQQEPTS